MSSLEIKMEFIKESKLHERYNRIRWKNIDVDTIDIFDIIKYLFYRNLCGVTLTSEFICKIN